MFVQGKSKKDLSCEYDTQNTGSAHWYRFTVAERIPAPCTVIINKILRTGTGKRQKISVI
jgi:hypothetical protein